jgi:hypothetical protein
MQHGAPKEDRNEAARFGKKTGESQAASANE